MSGLFEDCHSVLLYCNADIIFQGYVKGSQKFTGAVAIFFFGNCVGAISCIIRIAEIGSHHVKLHSGSKGKAKQSLYCYYYGKQKLDIPSSF